ncbi:MAG: hypothetical protein HYW27_04205, partial [Candidatus Aenigmarchaeota archaeon]|nr:hypothetical protein [Candidatus Aenigmarchaeota archaeon]
MKIWAIPLLLIVLPVAYASSLQEYNIDLSINDDGGSEWTVKLDYNETTSKSDYFIFGTPSDLEITADGKVVKCAVTPNVGTSVICNGVNSKTMVYKFRIGNSVETLGGLRRFSYKFSITQFTDKFSASVKLPLGAAIVENPRLQGTGLQRFEPSFG